MDEAVYSSGIFKFTSIWYVDYLCVISTFINIVVQDAQLKEGCLLRTKRTPCRDSFGNPKGEPIFLKGLWKIHFKYLYEKTLGT